MATGAKVVTEMTAGMVLAVDIADFDGGTVVVPHGAMVDVAHDAVSKFLMRPNSL